MAAIEMLEAYTLHEQLLGGRAPGGRCYGFLAYGRAVPQGSLGSVYSKQAGRHVVRGQSSQLLAWRGQLADACAKAMKGAPLLAGPVALVAVFFSPKPKSWPKRRTQPDTKPDWDKLARAVGDALEGVAYRNDSQIVAAVVCKRLGEPARVEIVLSEVVTT